MGLTATTKKVFTGLTLAATLTGAPVAFADQPVQTPAQKEMAALLNVYKQQLEKNTDSQSIDQTTIHTITKIGTHCGTLAAPAIDLLVKMDNFYSIESLGEVAAQCQGVAKKTVNLIATFETGHAHPSQQEKNWERGAVAHAASAIAVRSVDTGLHNDAMKILETLAEAFSNDVSLLASADNRIVMNRNWGVVSWPAESNVSLIDQGEKIAESLKSLGMKSTPMAARANFALEKIKMALEKAPRSDDVTFLSRRIQQEREHLDQYLQTISGAPRKKGASPS